MQEDLKTGGPLGQVGNWIFIAFLHCLRAEMSLGANRSFLGRRGDHLSPFGTSCSPSFTFFFFFLSTGV
jgi:hypothetical protein